MSTNLYWRPVPKEIPAPRDIGGLKRRLGNRLWGHDGTLHGDTLTVGKELLPYLEGLKDAGTGETAEDATELIEAIRENGSVELWIELSGCRGPGRGHLACLSACEGRILRQCGWCGRGSTPLRIPVRGHCSR